MGLGYAGRVTDKPKGAHVAPQTTLPAVRGIDLLRARYSVGKHLRDAPRVDAKQLESWVRATSETLQRVFGEDSAAREFSAMEGPRLDARLVVLEGLIQRAEELYAEPLATAATRVVVCPGRDEAASRAVIDFLESIECKHVVAGRPGEPESVMRAFEEHQDLGFAIVILTGDAARGVGGDGLLELGFLLGKLGRARVCVVQTEPAPSERRDDAVLRLELDERGEWQDRIAKALRDGGIQ